MVPSDTALFWSSMVTILKTIASLCPSPLHLSGEASFTWYLLHLKNGREQNRQYIYIYMNHRNDVYNKDWYYTTHKYNAHGYIYIPGDSIVALFSGNPLVGYTFCHPWAFFEGLRTFWGFQWIWALFGVQTHFTPSYLLNSWRNPQSYSSPYSSWWKPILEASFASKLASIS